MTTHTIAERFIRFFERNQHRAVPSSSLVPANDPTVLLTTAGMQQFKAYFTGSADAEQELGGRRAASVQRCFRTSDIDAVGDPTHLTLFEMLGNFSFGDYGKDEAIRLAWEFLTQEVKLDGDRIDVTVFAGDAAVPADEEAVRIWTRYLPKARIHRFGRASNWWGPVGDTGPMGPCSELHYDRTRTPCAKGAACAPNCECGRWLEVWNLVFVQFEQRGRGRVAKLDAPSIDTGMGLERLAMLLQNVPTVYDTDRFERIFHAIDHLDPAGATESPEERLRRRRIIADHLRGVTWLLFDGVTYSNKGQGSILRRLTRRTLDLLTNAHAALDPLVSAVVHAYAHSHPELAAAEERIRHALREEAARYEQVLLDGIAAVQRKHGTPTPAAAAGPSSRALAPAVAFELITAYGVSATALTNRGYTYDPAAVQALLEQHRTVSKQGAVRKFGGHGLNDPGLDPKDRAAMTRMHTATHLLHQALRTVLGPSVQQAGSDIRPDRFRFDFTFDRKVTPDELQRIEVLVNERVHDDLPVTVASMPLAAAQASGALSFFRERYPETVTVYTIGDPKAGTVFSREICGGPHVTRSGEVGRVRILKEEASSAGVRRIRATVEPRP